jgi:hypothetical protein
MIINPLSFHSYYYHCICMHTCTQSWPATPQVWGACRDGVAASCPPEFSEPGPSSGVCVLKTCALGAAGSTTIHKANTIHRYPCGTWHWYHFFFLFLYFHCCFFLFMLVLCVCVCVGVCMILFPYVFNYFLLFYFSFLFFLSVCLYACLSMSQKAREQHDSW